MERAAPPPAPAISPTRAPQCAVTGRVSSACSTRRALVPYTPRRPQASPLYRVLAEDPASMDRRKNRPLSVGPRQAARKRRFRVPAMVLLAGLVACTAGDIFRIGFFADDFHLLDVARRMPLAALLL